MNKQEIAKLARMLNQLAFALLNRCPHCGEFDADLLPWLNEDTLQCESCGHIYKVQE